MIFLDNFRALDSYIQSKHIPGPVRINPNFPNFKPFNVESIHKNAFKLLSNGLSAEYALRITPVVNDEQYLQSSLHWIFPQAYYSVYFSARAFLAAQGFYLANEDQIRRKVNALVVAGYYPKSINFYGYGVVKPFQIWRIDNNADSAETLNDFVADTRRKSVKKQFQVYQTNPRIALRNQSTGQVLENVNNDQLRVICKDLGYTTYFDLLCRLRISSTNREIERYITDTIDVRAFHQSLVNIVNHINGIHEAYIAYAIGLDTYRVLINGLPNYLREGFVRDRLNQIVEPTVKPLMPKLVNYGPTLEQDLACYNSIHPLPSIR
ncbi:hypothetical protein [Spirosoma sp. 48-14]|uniref:hypothetical protein n=1 Tax=Spirosoma sp. 48-14 TaxID=1895854 RepID=UPI00095CE80B|nr:hypothetical protein [Spirosoma sp. 48-14]OJW78421.1 MAG: hypothetical protein BGO59_30945 [Spirosoma sp. 48-14]